MLQDESPHVGGTESVLGARKLSTSSFKAEYSAHFIPNRHDPDKEGGLTGQLASISA